MEIRKIPLYLVTPSPMNPRKTFDEGELQELADNIEKQGLLQPITVRPIKDKKQFAVVEGNADFHPKYEIICGERRFRAFSKLSDKWREMDCVAPKGTSFDGFSDIPAIIREMNDEEAFDAMITENLQRKDVDPMEEAYAFSQLVKNGKTVEEVAMRFGKSIRFVNDRIKLNNLIPELMLAVKDDKMPLAAAMIIAKLDEDQQRKFHSQYQHNYNGYSKASAEQFISELFLTIDHSLWYLSENEADKDFEGGCGRKCSECQSNTANHGCLFWEMKGQDAGRCTNRSGYNAKTLEFMLKEIDLMSGDLVKKGEALEFGKKVLILSEDRISKESEVIDFVGKLKEAISERGYEVVDQHKVFKSRCFYGDDDERTQEFINNGTVYQCVNLYNWRVAVIQHERWYVKKGDTGTNVNKGGTPYQVTEILERLKNDERGLESSLRVAGAEALAKCTPSSDPLTKEEQVMMMTCMLNNNHMLCSQSRISSQIYFDPRELHRYILDHPDKWSQFVRAWMFQQINGSHANLLVASSMLDSFGAANCPEEYQAAKGKVEAKYKKTRTQNENKLKKLGYGVDGKPLKPEAIKIPAGKDFREQYDTMKKKHPDAVILFRVGDFYECFDTDAEKAAEVLKLTVTKTKKGKLAGFPHHALDTYLPKLVRAGVRVAICEQLEDPKKK